jgi:hypothetical protein
MTGNLGCTTEQQGDILMSRNSDACSVSRRQFLAAAGTIATASSFSVGKDSDSTQGMPPIIPVDYVITIKVKNGTISYSAKDVHGHVVTLHNNGLQVNPKDSVKWEIDNDDGKYRVTIGFFKTPTTPLVDKNDNPLYSVSGTEADYGTQNIWGRIGSAANKTYNYSVRVHDAKGSHADDPTIIVGKPGRSEKLKEAKGELREVRDKIAAIEEELGEVIGELGK